MASPIQQQPWTFVQQGPPNRTLTLSGPNAPFGRPRKGAVMEQERELRMGTTYYPGNRVPDRHIFGDKHTPIILTGRFMDSRIGVLGGAQAMWDQLDQFVSDQVICRAQWGSVAAFTGIITKCKRGTESAEEFTWSLTMDIDSDDTKPIQAPVQAPTNASTSAAACVLLAKSGLEQVDPNSIPADITYKPSFLDSIRNFTSMINGIVGSVVNLSTALNNPLSAFSAITATFVNLAHSVDNFDANLAADVVSFRASIAQFKTATLGIQREMSTGVNDFSIATGQASSQNSWAQNQAIANESWLEILGVLAAMDLQAEIVLKGIPDKTYTVCDHDTLESVAKSQLGSAGQADNLRQANGLRYGGSLTPGQVLHIPKPT